MTLKDKEDRINEQLRELDPAYAIANLRPVDPSSARYEFDIVKDFARKHLKVVEPIFQSVLGVKGKHHHHRPAAIRLSEVASTPTHTAQVTVGDRH